ncbi:hypothetical protein EB796_006580 [Bugula neritina]|uniref:Uncharacterized protein n=1 Tax=Bugula neritina TaxID=10212 RepID=A0A7J7KAA2_BUGNE|nr:hypothetical protein EB796_006580 [Bugula neritina]
MYAILTLIPVSTDSDSFLCCIQLTELTSLEGGMVGFTSVSLQTLQTGLHPGPFGLTSITFRQLGSGPGPQPISVQAYNLD